MPKFTVAVRFSGKIEYEIDRPTESEAMEAADNMAVEESRLGALEDIDWEVKSCTCVQN